MKSKRKMFQSVGYLTLFFTVAIATGYAQNPYGQLAPDPRMVVIPVRSMQDITTDLDNATATKQLSHNRNLQAVFRLNEIEHSIQDREVAITDIDRRQNDVKINGRQPEATSLKIESDANKQAIDLLKRLKSLREAEIEVAKVEEDHADITIRVFQMENELRGKRDEYNGQTNTSQNNLKQNTAHQVIGELEVSLLKLQQELAESTQKVAVKQKGVISQRMKLHEAQLELGM